MTAVVATHVVSVSAGRWRSMNHGRRYRTFSTGRSLVHSTYTCTGFGFRDSFFCVFRIAAHTEADLQNTLDVFAEAYTLLGLTINATKSKVLFQPAQSLSATAAILILLKILRYARKRQSLCIPSGQTSILNSTQDKMCMFCIYGRLKHNFNSAFIIRAILGVHWQYWITRTNIRVFEQADTTIMASRHTLLVHNRTGPDM